MIKSQTYELVMKMILIRNKGRPPFNDPLAHYSHCIEYGKAEKDQR